MSKKIQPRIRVKVSDLRRQIAALADERNRYQWDLSTARNDLAKRDKEIESLKNTAKYHEDWANNLRAPIRRLAMWLDMMGVPSDRRDTAANALCSYPHGMNYAVDEARDLYEVEARLMYWLTTMRHTKDFHANEP